GYALFAFEIGHHGIRRQFFYALHFLAEPHGYPGVAQMIAERFNNLAIRKFEQAVTFFNQGHPHAENGEHAGVFNAHDTSTYHDQGMRQRGQAEYLVAVDDGSAVDRHLRGCRGLGADGDDDAIGLKRGFRLRPLDAYLMRTEKTGNAVNHVDAIA